MHDLSSLFLSPPFYFSFGSFVLSRAYIQLPARQTVGRGSLLAVKEDILRSIKAFIALEQSYLGSYTPVISITPSAAFPRAATGTRSLRCLWDLQVTLPVTPRKLGLTTLTGPNCFLPAIRPWPTSRADVLEKFQRDHCPWNHRLFISFSTFTTFSPLQFIFPYLIQDFTVNFIAFSVHHFKKIIV